MNTNKLNIILIGLIILLVIVTFTFLISIPTLNSFYLLTIPLTIILLTGVFLILKNRFKSLKNNLPTEDELSTKISHKAGYYTFIATIYVALLIGIFEKLIAELLGQKILTGTQTIGFVILISGILFVFLAFYLNKKGEI